MLHLKWVTMISCSLISNDLWTLLFVLAHIFVILVVCLSTMMDVITLTLRSWLFCLVRKVCCVWAQIQLCSNEQLLSSCMLQMHSWNSTFNYQWPHVNVISMCMYYLIRNFVRHYDDPSCSFMKTLFFWHCNTSSVWIQFCLFKQCAMTISCCQITYVVQCWWHECNSGLDFKMQNPSKNKVQELQRHPLSTNRTDSHLLNMVHHQL
jgi:hypothetical protein